MKGCSSIGGYSVFPVPFIEKAIFSPTHVLNSFVENQMLVFVRVFYSIPLVSMSVSLCQYYEVFIAVPL
jgi:hypothetical protein